MTPTQRQIKIAELCGKKSPKVNGNGQVVYFIPTKDFGDVVELCPDYLDNLNAMHEVEDSVIFKAGKSLIDAYEENLLITVSDLTREQWVDEIHHWHATAAQRAEALVLTLEPEINHDTK